MRIPTQEQVKDWINGQRTKNGYTYEDFARDVGREVQTVRGWMQETNRKLMPRQALLAAARVMRDTLRSESQVSRATGDMTPDEWKHVVEIAQDQGMFLWEFVGQTLRERVEIEDSLTTLEGKGIVLQATPRALKQVARLKDAEARDSDDERTEGYLRGYAAALRDVARVV